MDTIEDLRALDRRLLALEGDLQSRLQHEFSVVGVEFQVPWADEIGRIEIELGAIASESDMLAERLGMPRFEPSDAAPLAFSRSDAREAYDDMRSHTERLREHVGQLLARALVADPSRAAEVPQFDEEPTSKDVTGHVRRRLAPLGTAMIVVPLIATLVYGAWAHDRKEMLEAAVEICASEPPCPGEPLRIAFGQGLRRHGSDLVLLRRSADCRREVEVYFSDEGSYMFRGSLDEPDPALREAFMRKRDAWYRHHEIVATVACEHADTLCGWVPFGC